MATSEEKQELVDTLSGPRYYRVLINGYGGESAYMSISKEATVTVHLAEIEFTLKSILDHPERKMQILFSTRCVSKMVPVQSRPVAIYINGISWNFIISVIENCCPDSSKKPLFPAR